MLLVSHRYDVEVFIASIELRWLILLSIITEWIKEHGVAYYLPSESANRHKMKDYKQLFGYAAILFGIGFVIRSFMPAYALDGPTVSMGSNPVASFAGEASSDKCMYGIHDASWS